MHATVVLALQQLLATPLHVVRESLTSPFNLAALLPFFDEGSLPARILGTVELFGLWWALLLAVGCRAPSPAGRAPALRSGRVARARMSGVAAVVAARWSAYGRKS